MKRITLAWQDCKNGVRHVRRFDVDDQEKFYGWQLQTPDVIRWLEAHGNPVWPFHMPFEGLLSKALPPVYEVIE